MQVPYQCTEQVRSPWGHEVSLGVSLVVADNGNERFAVSADASGAISSVVLDREGAVALVENLTAALRALPLQVEELPLLAQDVMS